MGDIKEAWPNFQGFDYAAFPIHQQGQLTIFHDDAADEEVSIGIGDNNYDDRYTMDGWLRTDASSMVTGVEGRPRRKCSRSPHGAGRALDRGQVPRDERALPGAGHGAAARTGGKDEAVLPAVLAALPADRPAHRHRGVHHAQRRDYVEKMKLVDQWIGEMMAEMETSGSPTTPWSSSWATTATSPSTRPSPVTPR